MVMKTPPIRQPGSQADAADHEPDEQRDRQCDRKAFRRHEADRHRRQSTGDTGIGSAEAEHSGLAAGDVDPCRLGCRYVLADRHDGAPDAAPEQVIRHDQAKDQRSQCQEVVPLPRRQRQAERHGRRRHHHPLGAAGPPSKRRQLEDLRRRDRQRERRECQIDRCQPPRRPPECIARRKASDRRQHDRRSVSETRVLDHYRRDIGTDADERTLPQRELTVEAGEQIEAENGDGMDQHHTSAETSRSRS